MVFGLVQVIQFLGTNIETKLKGLLLPASKLERLGQIDHLHQPARCIQDPRNHLVALFLQGDERLEKEVVAISHPIQGRLENSWRFLKIAQIEERAGTLFARRQL